MTVRTAVIIMQMIGENACVQRVHNVKDIPAVDQRMSHIDQTADTFRELIKHCDKLFLIEQHIVLDPVPYIFHCQANTPGNSDFTDRIDVLQHPAAHTFLAELRNIAHFMSMQHHGLPAKLLIDIKSVFIGINEPLTVRCTGRTGCFDIGKRSVESDRDVHKTSFLVLLVLHKIRFVRINAQFNSCPGSCYAVCHIQQKIIIVIVGTERSIGDNMHKTRLLSHVIFTFQYSIICLFVNFGQRSAALHFVVCLQVSGIWYIIGMGR